MEWNVYYYNINKRCIEPYNILDHSSFYNDLTYNYKLFKEDKDTFKEYVRRDLQYYFWSKCEYEIVIDSWPPCNIDKKVDIYSQVMLNFDIFIDVIWNYLASIV